MLITSEASVGDLLREHQRLVRQRGGRAEAREVQLGAQVVLVEHELDFRHSLNERADGEERVRRVAGLDDVEAAAAGHARTSAAGVQPDSTGTPTTYDDRAASSAAAAR